ncbi:TPA: hypothetical protein ACXYKD_003978 [Legionella anisa]
MMKQHMLNVGFLRRNSLRSLIILKAMGSGVKSINKNKKIIKKKAAKNKLKYTKIN